MKKNIRILFGMLFVVYLIGLDYFLFFAEKYGRTGMESYSYNLIPFVEIRRFLKYGKILGWESVFLNLAGNIIGFIPFGFFFPMLFVKVRRLSTVFLLSMEFSLSIECLQLIFKVGSFDVDDILLNTLGGWIGGILYFAGRKLYGSVQQYRKRNRKDEKKSKEKS